MIMFPGCCCIEQHWLFMHITRSVGPVMIAYFRLWYNNTTCCQIKSVRLNNIHYLSGQWAIVSQTCLISHPQWFFTYELYRLADAFHSPQIMSINKSTCWAGHCCVIFYSFNFFTLPNLWSHLLSYQLLDLRLSLKNSHRHLTILSFKFASQH